MKPTAKQKRHFARVAALNCIICGNHAQIHHIRTGQGMGQRDHDATIPLCVYHHLGGSNHPAIHANKLEFEERFGTEEELLEKVNNLLKRCEHA
jgi:hypothetical protein